MRRRELLLLVGGAVTAPHALRAEQKALPVIGYLVGGAPDPAAPFAAAFRQGLNEAGYVEGQNVMIEYRGADGRFDRMPALAAGLVERKVDVIATDSGTLSAQAEKSATSTIPIVFFSGDPVAAGGEKPVLRDNGGPNG